VRINRMCWIAILVCVLVSVSCKQKAEENGWVQFDLYGETYTFDQRRFMIRANPRMGEGERMKTIEEGQTISFEFSIGPTRARAKKELEVVGKELRELAEGNVPEAEGVSTFDLVWFIDTADPIGSLEQKISYDTPGLNLGTFVFNINVPEYTLGPSDLRHNCWVVVDELTDKRAKGRFGGVLQANSRQDASVLGEPVEIDGVFDVPFEKLYRHR